MLRTSYTDPTGGALGPLTELVTRSSWFAKPIAFVITLLSASNDPAGSGVVGSVWKTSCRCTLLKRLLVSGRDPFTPLSPDTAVTVEGCDTSWENPKNAKG